MLASRHSSTWSVPLDLLRYNDTSSKFITATWTADTYYSVYIPASNLTNGTLYVSVLLPGKAVFLLIFWIMIYTCTMGIPLDPNWSPYQYLLFYIIFISLDLRRWSTYPWKNSLSTSWYLFLIIVCLNQIYSINWIPQQMCQCSCCNATCTEHQLLQNICSVYTCM